MGFMELIAGLFKPAADLVDNLHTSEEERGQIKHLLFAAQAERMMLIAARTNLRRWP